MPLIDDLHHHSVILPDSTILFAVYVHFNNPSDCCYETIDTFLTYTLPTKFFLNYRIVIGLPSLSSLYLALAELREMSSTVPEISILHRPSR
jgi:hypothetical protein